MAEQSIVAQFSRFVESTWLKSDQAAEFFGPTDVSAQSSNPGLAVGVNDAGTLTVFRWPRPSFYELIGRQVPPRC